MTDRSAERAAVDRNLMLTQAFVEMADTLVVEFDVSDFLSVLARRCATLFSPSESGLVLADTGGSLGIAASSCDAVELLELFELQHAEGPGVDAFQTGTAVIATHLHEVEHRWPQFVPEAIAAGFHSAYTFPMRLRDQLIGAMSLLRAEDHPLDADDLAMAQALTDVATIGILQHRAAGETRLLAEQLQYALNNRVSIEQAKGVLAEYGRLTMEDAFQALRGYARNHNEPLAEVARAVARRTLSCDVVIRGAIGRTHP